MKDSKMTLQQKLNWAKNLTEDELLETYVNSVFNDRYGDKAEQIKIVKDEIKRRINGRNHIDDLIHDIKICHKNFVKVREKLETMLGYKSLDEAGIFEVRKLAQEFGYWQGKRAGCIEVLYYFDHELANELEAKYVHESISRGED